MEVEKFLKSHGITVFANEKEAIAKLPRFIRFHHWSMSESSKLGDEIKEELIIKRLSEPYQNVFAIDPSASLSSTRLWKEGKILGVDLSSIVAVHALELDSNDRFLDLCCAPGVKLSIASDIIGADGNGSLTGVDISKPRLSACVSLVKKNRQSLKVRCFLCDSLQFGQLAPKSLNQEYGSVARKRCKLDQGKPFYQSKLYKSQGNQLECTELYDKVLVDAECSHDGSVRHVLKTIDKMDGKCTDAAVKNDRFLSRISSEQELASLYELQKGLLRKGLDMLKVGGILVYSTCSLSPKQNEEIVSEVLRQCHGSVELLPIPDAILPVEYPVICKDPFIYFDPGVSQTSGMFIAKMTRKRNSSSQ